MELANLNQSTGVQQVLAEYQKAQDELAVAQTRFTPEHPKVKDLAAKEQALREQLEKRVGKIVDTKQPVGVNTNTGGYYHSKGYYGVKPEPKEKESETMIPPLRIG